MKILSLFNNKGGVGKTTLTYHLAHILATPEAEGGLGKRVLLIDLDPQSNLTILALGEEVVEKIWEEENAFIESGFQDTKNDLGKNAFETLLKKPRTIHFLLKPTEEGITDETILPPPVPLNRMETLSIIPGRLSIQTYEATIAERWSGAYVGNQLSIRTITRIRKVAEVYAQKYSCDFVIMDTSPSLGALNKVVISMADGFIIPCMPDLFSLYGIKNIGKALSFWEKEFQTMARLQRNSLKDFQKSFVNFLGYTIFNAKSYKNYNKWDLSQAHYNYVLRFPKAIEESFNAIPTKPIPNDIIKEPIGDIAIMHTHNTFPSQAQKYKCPMWELPNAALESGDYALKANKVKFEKIKQAYAAFAIDLLKRVATYLEPVSITASK
jgi:cellulose biosynthesis protein BcsQ